MEQTGQTKTNNEIFRLAATFVDETSEHVFLTGKAGTGKTTFLKYIKDHCGKRIIVAAPTGVAAVNAGGVTLHSFFQLSVDPFVPEIIPSLFREGYFRYSRQKIEIMRQLELLIIDEISMLRADVLDAVDFCLRRVRKSKEVFGGVQMLYIGDLLQLPPITQEKEKELLKPYYRSSYFFDSIAFKKKKPVLMELTEVYRQQESSFIEVLNRIRNGAVRKEDEDLLNTRYSPSFKASPGDEYITITTHKYKADQINRKNLETLSSELHRFEGEIKGEFHTGALPTEKTLLLKEGAQVMFLKNDAEEPKRYFNGKIGHISRINEREIYVKAEENEEEIQIKTETWENTAYTLDKESGQLVGTPIGTFTQYPLKLAWAITVHKSQGLTFDKVILDIGSAFAPGQLYVALSRCKSLKGIILSSEFRFKEMLPDFDRSDLFEAVIPTSEAEKTLEEEKIKFRNQKLLSCFDPKILYDTMGNLSKLLEGKEGEEYAPLKSLLKNFRETLSLLNLSYARLKNVFPSLCEEFRLQGDPNLIKEKLGKGVSFFHEKIVRGILIPLQKNIEEFPSPSKAKTLYKHLHFINDDISLFLKNLQGIRFDEIRLADGLSLKIPEIRDIFKGEKPVKKKSGTVKTEKAIEKTSSPKPKLGTVEETFSLLKEGKNIDEIAGIRNLASSTIEGHVARLVREGLLKATDFVKEEDLKRIIRECSKYREKVSLRRIFSDLEGNFSFGQIQIAQAWLSHESSKEI